MIGFSYIKIKAYFSLDKSNQAIINFSLFIATVIILHPEAEFKEFEPRLKFKPQLKYGWFHFKLY